MKIDSWQETPEECVLSTVNRLGVVRIATVMGLTGLKSSTAVRALESLEKQSAIIKIGNLEGLGKGSWFGKRSRSWEAAGSDKAVYQSLSTNIRVKRHWVGVAQCVEWWTEIDGIRIISENELREEYGWYDKKCGKKGQYFTPVPDFAVIYRGTIWRVEVQFSRKEKGYWENRFKNAPEHGWLVWWMMDGKKFDNGSSVIIRVANGSKIQCSKALYLKDFFNRY